MKYENLDHGFVSEDKEHMEYREKADTLTSTRPSYHRTKVRVGLRRSNDAEIADFGYHRFISGSENSQKQVNFIERRYIVGQRCAAFFVHFFYALLQEEGFRRSLSVMDAAGM